jgi:conflict system pore-forming effector with SLATT domain
MDPASSFEHQSERPLKSLRDQLRQMYGRAAYAQKTHQQTAGDCIMRYKLIKNIEIALAAIILACLLVALFNDSHTAIVVGALLTTIWLGLTPYFKTASLAERAQKHTVVATKLLAAQEKLVRLLVDINCGRAIDEIRQVRDRVQEMLEDIYESAPRTDSRVRHAEQRELTVDEEKFFSDEELDQLLPQQLRSNKF